VLPKREQKLRRAAKTMAPPSGVSCALWVRLNLKIKCGVDVGVPV
jgi:hypothetical protein